jgi:hypothetical protein
MCEIDHFKVFVVYSGDVAADVDYLHIKRIHLVCYSYIVRIELDLHNLNQRTNHIPNVHHLESR